MTDLDKIKKLHESDNFFVVHGNGDEGVRVYAEQTLYFDWQEVPYITLYHLNKNLEITSIFQDVGDWNQKLESFTKAMADGCPHYKGLIIYRKER